MNTRTQTYNSTPGFLSPLPFLGNRQSQPAIDFGLHTQGVKGQSQGRGGAESSSLKPERVGAQPLTTGADSWPPLGDIKEPARGLPAAAGTSWPRYGTGDSDPCGPRAAHPCCVCTGHGDSARCLRVSRGRAGAGSWSSDTRQTGSAATGRVCGRLRLRAPASVAAAGGEAGKRRPEWPWDVPRVRAVGSSPRTRGSPLGPHHK